MVGRSNGDEQIAPFDDASIVNEDRNFVFLSISSVASFHFFSAPYKVTKFFGQFIEAAGVSGVKRDNFSRGF